MKTSHTLAAAALIASAFTATAQELPENLYLIGDATAAGWNCNAPVKMQKVNDYEFTYTGELTKGEFKLPWVVGGDMWGSNTFMPMEAGTKVTKAGLKNNESYLTHNGQPDQKWVVEDAGVYTLTFRIDRDDTNFGALDATYVSELPKSIFMLGAATDSWDSNSATPVYEKDGKYVWTGDLNYYDEDKLVKFCMTRGAWDQVTFMVPDEVNLNGNVLQIEAGKTYTYQESAETEPGALKDWFWGIREGQSGEYEITVDTDAKTVSFKLLKSYAFDKDNVTELYMLGLVAESFDSNHPLPMTSLGNGKFRWSGEIYYATTDGDEQHANKQFKFVTPKGDWNKVYYLVPTGAEADGFIQEVEPGSYPVKMTTWTDGKSGVDAFFGVKEGTKGEFTITVDVPNLTFTLTSGKSGIEAVKTADFSAMISCDILTVNGVEGEVALYDVAGRKVLGTIAGTTDVSGLAAGIYVVSTAKGSVKIYKK